MENQTALVTWNDAGVPVSEMFDDPYFSLENGLEETRYVFLGGNNLPERFRDGFHVAELGFGTGLNFLATVDAWRAAGTPGKLFFTSFEAFPMSASDMSHALHPFKRISETAQELISVWSPDGGDFQFDNVHLRVVVGDARKTLPQWQGRADAWYLDGFSPAKNPELWAPELMAEVGARTAPEGTCATYTAAGFVRRGLSQAGFEIQRMPGFGKKRHMSCGVMASGVDL